MKKTELKETYKSILNFYGDHAAINKDAWAERVNLPRAEADPLLESMRDIKEKRQENIPILAASPYIAPYKEEPVPTPVLPKPKKPPSKKKAPPVVSVENSYVVTFLKVSALPFAFLALGLSIYFSMSFLSKQFPWIMALLLSCTLVGFGVFAFECFSLFMKRKAWGWMAFFGALWVCVTIYTVGTSTSSLYESYLNRVQVSQAKASTSDANRQLYSNYQDEEANLQQQIEDKRKRLEIQQTVMETFDTYEKQQANKAAYNNAYWLAGQLEKEIAGIQTKISETRDKRQKLLIGDSTITTIGVNRKGIYEWLAGIFKTSADMIQFVLQVIPAAVLDIIAPLSLYIFLFLRKKTT
jgi:hypothetical protein